MRRIYFILGALLLLFAFYGGYKFGAPSVDIDKLEDVIKERDSLTTALTLSLEREKALMAVAMIAKEQYHESDEKVKDLENEKQEQAIAYEKKIKAIKKYTAAQTDSFLTARFPKPRTFNPSIKPIVIPEWRANEIAQTLARLDSVIAYANSLDTINGQLKESIDRRDRFISIQEEIIHQKNLSFQILEQREMTFAEESKMWRKEAIKYKRQRNLAIAGGVMVIGGIGYILLNNALSP